MNRVEKDLPQTIKFAAGPFDDPIFAEQPQRML